MESPKEPLGLTLFRQYNDLMDELMEPPETQIKHKDLYIVHTFVDEVFTETTTGKTYISLEGIGARFWVGPGTNLHPGDPIKLMFHKEDTHATRRNPSIDPSEPSEES